MIMALTLKILIYFCLCAGVQSVQQITWLPCQFTDEHLSVNNKSLVDSHYIYREAMLQFGQTGDSPVNPRAITFLVTGSKLDLRRYIEGVEAEQLECELRRYSTEGIHVRWPVQGAQGYNYWFSCTLKHIKGLFTVTGFLRQPSDQPPPGQQDYLHWPAINNGETLTTTVAIVIKTLTPSVKARIGSQQKLHCQFVIDHRGSEVTVEWHRLHRGKKIKLFSHNSRSGQTEGTGVGLKELTGGNASYTLPFTKMSSEATYICSVSVTPLVANLDIKLHITEPPRVSLNVEPTLSLQDGEEQMIVCDAERYYPLDVEITWYKQKVAMSDQGVATTLPKLLSHSRRSGHKHNKDNTFSVSAVLYLQAWLRDSGKQFTCSIFHQSLSEPIRKSFILNVEEPVSWKFNLIVSLTGVTLFAILYKKLRYLRSGRKQSAQNQPY